MATPRRAGNLGRRASAIPDHARPPRPTGVHPASGAPADTPAERRGGTGGTQRCRLPLESTHNCTGGDWSRLRSDDQGKRAEEGNDELVNHALQKTQAPTLIALTLTPSLPDSGS